MPNFIYKNSMIEYTLSRNAKKNLNLTIKNNGDVHVSAPRHVSIKAIEKFLLERADWIISTRKNIMNKAQNVFKDIITTNSHTYIYGREYIIKIISGKFNNVFFHDNLLTLQIKEKYINNQDYINAYFDNWQKEHTYNLSNELIDKYLIKLGKYKLSKPELSIRTMTGRWGSCIPSKNKITINKNLIYPPTECLEYVVLHELSHLVEANHSKAFYNIIEGIMPDWKSRKNKLNNF